MVISEILNYEGAKMTEDNANNLKGYDTTILYDYKKHPDLISGRCENCGNAHFFSSVKDNIFVR
jgi:hypothetical protein